jgi:hypothetical protein
MYVVCLQQEHGTVKVQCQSADEALSLCTLWRAAQNLQTDEDWIGSMHQPVFVE